MSLTQRLIDTKDAAVFLGESEANIRSLVNQGILPHIRLGKKIKFDLDKLEEFISDGGKGHEDNQCHP